jgi:hypothetical protein
MRCVKKYQLSKEPIEVMIASGRLNPCRTIKFKDKTGEHNHNLLAGTDDIVHVYHEDGQIFVLSQHPSFPYVGLQIFEGDQEIGDVFLQDGQIKEAIGREDLAPFNTIKRMANCLPC